MKLSVILLTWNSEKHVEKCIGSIIKGMEAIDSEIIVIDNGSSDDTLKIIKSQFPFIKLISNKSNLGVAPARNQGIKTAQGEYILILDIDTYVYPGTIEKLISYMSNHPETGLCGPMLCFDDGTIQNSFRRFPVMQTKLLRRINTKWGRKFLKNEYYDVNGPDICQRNAEAFHVDYIIGACQLLRRSALDNVGLLDDKIFYGPEDVDICLRMWLNGWKVAYLQDAKVIHYEQRITKSKLFSYISLKHLQGLIYYFIKHRYLFSRRSLYRRLNRTENEGEYEP